ncbi:helix-turn-helix domain-containing protein [Mycobacterium shimoidei]
MALARDGKLSPYARAVALYVWSHDEKWQQSAAAVAEAIGLNRKTVAAALDELQGRGWLVREIHYNPGKSRPAWERWHLQMTNRPFTPDEIRELSATEGVRPTDTLTGEVSATRTHRCPSHGHMDGYQTDTIGMDSRNAPEVHSSNARTDQDETGLESRSLAVEGLEATGKVADSRSPKKGSSCEAASTLAAEQPANRQAVPSTATGGASEAPEGLVGLRPPTATGSPFDDPWAEPPAWVAKARAREGRASQNLEPATAATTWSHGDPWA